MRKRVYHFREMPESKLNNRYVYSYFTSLGRIVIVKFTLKQMNRSHFCPHNNAATINFFERIFRTFHVLKLIHFQKSRKENKQFNAILKDETVHSVYSIVGVR